MTETDPILDPLRRNLSKNLLASMVGRAIFCPGRHCGGAVLDVRRAVGLGSVVVCTTCWAATERKAQSQILAAAGNRDLDILDGPALHGQPPAVDLDTSSSGSRQHYIDTGEYLRAGEAEAYSIHRPDDDDDDDPDGPGPCPDPDNTDGSSCALHDHTETLEVDA